uniref:Uncharacterized protein n=1 Tax=Romanomermis culicivorax TaxID=13658 RepID=A0A915ISM3_ROMCU
MQDADINTKGKGKQEIVLSHTMIGLSLYPSAVALFGYMMSLHILFCLLIVRNKNSVEFNGILAVIMHSSSAVQGQ